MKNTKNKKESNKPLDSNTSEHSKEIKKTELALESLYCKKKELEERQTKLSANASLKKFSSLLGLRVDRDSDLINVDAISWVIKRLSDEEISEVCTYIVSMKSYVSKIDNISNKIHRYLDDIKSEKEKMGLR